MTIKTQDGTENVASLGLGQLGTTLGAIGTGLGILNGGLGILGGNGMSIGANGRMMNQNDPDSSFVTRHELDLVQQLQAKDIQLSAKDSEIALQKANQYTDQKIVETYSVIANRAKELEATMNANRIAQEQVNANQMAWNATAQGTMSAIATQVANLASVTKVFIPSSNVCENGCGCNCSNS